MLIKYCPHCHWDEESKSKAIPPDKTAAELTHCPLCGFELAEDTEEDRP